MRKRGSVASGLDAFSRAYGLTKGVMSDIDAQEVTDTMKAGMESSRADAEASGKDAYTMTSADTGTDTFSSKEDRDALAQQSRDISEMSGETSPGLSSVASKSSSSEPADSGVTTQDVKTPQLSAMDIFHKKYAPNVSAKLIEQGKPEEAKRFDEWSKSAKGAAYGEAWSKAMTIPAKDGQGRINALVDLYNKQLPDGQYAQAKQGEDGQFTVEVRNDKTHAVVGRHTASEDEIYQLGAGMLSPAAQYQRLIQLGDAKTAAAEANARDDRKDARDDKKYENQLKIQEMRDDAAGVRQDKRDATLIRAAGIRHSGGGGGNGGSILTTAQQRANDEITAARQALDGMSRAEVMRKTQSATATGRNNPDFDPQLASQWKLANRRKYGDDTQFEAFNQPKERPGSVIHPSANEQPGRENPGDKSVLSQELQRAKQQSDITRRFSADPAMKGMRTGKLTPQGMEAIDANGRLVGHYN